MYSKKYRFEKIEQFNRPNYIYLEMEGRVCYPAYLKVGERGWILYEREDGPGGWPHWLNTSPIKDVEILSDRTLVITTQNTRLTLAVIE